MIKTLIYYMKKGLSMEAALNNMRSFGCDLKYNDIREAVDWLVKDGVVTYRY